jgi:hypothetical protein
MANIIDATAPVSISIVAQGFADIEQLNASPNPASPGVQINMTTVIRNTGATDTLWEKDYVNNVKVGSTHTFTLNSNVQHATGWNFTMPNSDAIVKVEAGHMVGTTEVMDDTMQITVSILALPEAIFVGTPTYSPGQQVEPGTPVTITYQINNTGGGGMLWGGLYDYQTPTPNLLGGYWEQNVVPGGAPVTKTVTVTVNANLNGQLLVGHFE